MPRTTPAPAEDLRQRILDTSEALLREAGIGGLSMREVARRAGVTHQAPYHHFADRESIVAELVTQGFDDLTRRLARANDRHGGGDRRALMVESGQAYVGFALDRPGPFRIMFRPELCDPTRFPQAMAAGERAHAELQRLVRLLHDGSEDPVLATVYWGYVHGLASLFVDGPMGQHVQGARERRAHVKAALEDFADGRLRATR